MSESVWLTGAELATTAGRQRRSIRRMLADGVFGDGARHDEDGEWRINPEAARAAGLRVQQLGGTGPEAATVVSEPAPASTLAPGDVEELHRRLADAERRALTAEAEAQQLREVLAGCQAAAGVLIEALHGRTGSPTQPHRAGRGGRSGQISNGAEKVALPF